MNTHEAAVRIAIEALLEIAAPHQPGHTARWRQLRALRALRDLDAVLPGSTGRG